MSSSRAESDSRDSSGSSRSSRCMDLFTQGYVMVGSSVRSSGVSPPSCGPRSSSPLQRSLPSRRHERRRPPTKKWTSSAVPSAQAGGTCWPGLPRAPSCATPSCPSSRRRWPRTRSAPAGAVELSQQGAERQCKPNPRPADSSGAPEAFGARLLVGAPPRAQRVTPPSWRPPQPLCLRPTGAQSFLCSCSWHESGIL